MYVKERKTARTRNRYNQVPHLSPVLTSGFNRLKPPRSICQKVVNTGQYESEWSIENSKGRFCGELRYLYRFCVLSIEKRKKKYCFAPAKGTFYGEIS